MRLRIERRTQIFDEACDLTARYYVCAFSAISTGVDDSFMVSLMCLDRKVVTHFSKKAYQAWWGVEKMIGRVPRATDTANAFISARASALSSLGKELR